MTESTGALQMSALLEHSGLSSMQHHIEAAFMRAKLHSELSSENTEIRCGDEKVSVSTFLESSAVN